MVKITKADDASLRSINQVYQVSWLEAFIVSGFEYGPDIYETLRECSTGEWKVAPKYSSVNFAVVNKESDAILLLLALETDKGKD